MVVYIEDLLIHNLVSVYALSALILRISGKRKSRLRCVIAAIFASAAAFAFPYFEKYRVLLVLLIITSVAIILFVAKRGLIRGLLLSAGVFVGISGGVGLVLELVSVFSKSYAPPDPYICTLFIAGVAIVGTLIHKNKISSLSDKYEVELTLLGKVFTLVGFVDTGNRLVDKVSGLPIIVLKASSVLSKIDEETAYDLASGNVARIKGGARFISYSTVSGSNNKMMIIKPQKTVIKSGKTRREVEVMVAISFSLLAGNFDLILHPRLTNDGEMIELGSKK